MYIYVHILPKDSLLSPPETGQVRLPVVFNGVTDIYGLINGVVDTQLRIDLGELLTSCIDQLI